MLRFSTDNQSDRIGKQSCSKSLINFHERFREKSTVNNKEKLF